MKFFYLAAIMFMVPFNIKKVASRTYIVMTLSSSFFIAGLSCNIHQFRCHDNSQCVSHWRVCNGRRDCRDGSDESQCSELDPSHSHAHYTVTPITQSHPSNSHTHHAVGGT